MKNTCGLAAIALLAAIVLMSSSVAWSAEQSPPNSYVSTPSKALNLFGYRRQQQQRQPLRVKRRIQDIERLINEDEFMSMLICEMCVKNVCEPTYCTLCEQCSADMQEPVIEKQKSIH